MKLRARVYKDPADGVWTVQLHTFGLLFGEKKFLSFEHARVWAIWRVTPSRPVSLHDWIAGG